MAASLEDRPPDEGTTIQLAKEMAYQGLPPDEIRRQLVAFGVDPGVAVFVVHQHAGVTDRAQQQAGHKQMALGGLIFLVGLAVTVLSYLSADGDGGGRFIVAYGAILVGGAQFLRGLVMSSRR